MTATTQIPGPAYRVVTPRLVIRCWEPADAPLLKAAIDASIEHLLPWMPWAANEPTDIDTKIALIRRFRGQFDLGQDFTYGIFDREETQALGGTGLHTRLGSDAREIGYWVRADGINRGVATEAAGALTRGRVRGGQARPRRDPLRRGQRAQRGRAAQARLHARGHAAQTPRRRQGARYDGVDAAGG